MAPTTKFDSHNRAHGNVAIQARKRTRYIVVSVIFVSLVVLMRPTGFRSSGHDADAPISPTNSRALSQLQIARADAQSDDIPVTADTPVSAADMVLNALPKAKAPPQNADIDSEKQMPDDETIAAGIKDDEMKEDSVDSGKNSQHKAIANGNGVVHERTAKIVTCPACRLNSLPLVKKFVHEHAPHFKPLLNVNFVFGEDPVLYLYEDGKQVAQHNLDKFSWEAIIELLVKFGIKPTSQNDEISSVISKMAV